MTEQCPICESYQQSIASLLTSMRTKMLLTTDYEAHRLRKHPLNVAAQIIESPRQLILPEVTP